jgi:hypothetical protein
LLRGTVGGEAQRGGHERCAGDDEAERERTDDDCSAPEPIGSPKTRIAERLAATEVIAITSIALPIWRLRVDA